MMYIEDMDNDDIEESGNEGSVVDIWQEGDSFFFEYENGEVLSKPCSMFSSEQIKRFV